MVGVFYDLCNPENAMGKNKLQQWAEINTFSNYVNAASIELLQSPHELKGKWHKEFFKNDNPIVLELGCGKGEYTIGLAKRFPQKNFLGVDIKSHRMWTGARQGMEEGISNAGFLRTRVDFIDSFFDVDEVDEIWLTFSDPHPQEGKARKRLTSPLFIERYRKFLKKDGLIHLKHDSDLMVEYTLDQIRENNYRLLLSSLDLYGRLVDDLDDETRDILEIRTFYEQMWLEKGKTIKYVKFSI